MSDLTDEQAAVVERVRANMNGRGVRKSGDPRSARKPNGAGDTAARAAKERNVPLYVIAAEYGVAASSVYAAWHRLFPGEAMPKRSR